MPKAKLTTVPIFEKSGYICIKEIKNESEKNVKEHKTKPNITLVSHACLLIEYDGFRLLTDPWIEGPAFMGSWISYPVSQIKIADLPKIDAIWISHEHSDHFHLPTLERLDKNIKIYVPDFDNKRLESLLRKIGFVNVVSIRQLEKVKIHKTIEITSFNSTSVWNDSILLIDLDGFTIINFNDAGINWNICNYIKKVDMICSAFSTGASGYPITWNHLSSQKKLEIIKEANKCMIKMLESMIETFKPTYLIPFASFSALYNPQHQQYLKMLEKNRPEGIVKYFSDWSGRVIDLLPGEVWRGEESRIIRIQNREKVFEETNFFQMIEKEFNKEENYAKFHPTQFTIRENEIINYFESFSDSDLAKEVGDITIEFIAKSESREIRLQILFYQGTIKCDGIKTPIKAHMKIECPGGIVEKIIHENLSWDEAHIGYWCKFSRDPDEYNIALWKLLHAPWKTKIKSKTEGKAIADIVEKGGERAVKTLEKYGLFCAGCNASLGETLNEGARLHGIKSEKLIQLKKELDELL